MLRIDDMLSARTVREGKEYAYGYYYNKKPVYGYYLYSDKSSLMDGLEIHAKSKFKLEKDPENYAQEVRLLTYMALNEYYNTFGEHSNDEDVKSWVYKVVSRKLIDMARCMKSNVSFYDVEKREYIINDIMYFDKNEDSDNDDNVMDKLNMYVEEYRRTIAQDSYSYFKMWLKENMNNILTKKQIGYLEGDEFISEKNQSSIHKNIIKRVDHVYSTESINEYKNDKLKNKMDILECVLDSDDEKVFSERLKYFMNTDEWIEDELYGLSLITCKEVTNLITNGNNLSKKTVYEISECLINLLNFLKSSKN